LTAATSDGLVTANKFRDEAAPFDVETLTMQLSTHTLALTANAGITSRVKSPARCRSSRSGSKRQRTNRVPRQHLRSASGNADVAASGDGSPA
jgi:hypothetical protein